MVESESEGARRREKRRFFFLPFSLSPLTTGALLEKKKAHKELFNLRVLLAKNETKTKHQSCSGKRALFFFRSRFFCLIFFFLSFFLSFVFVVLSFSSSSSLNQKRPRRPNATSSQQASSPSKLP